MGYTLPDLSYQKKVKEMDKESLVRHLKEFDLEIKPSVGIWYFSPGASRFHDKYFPDRTIKERLKVIGDLAEHGVKGIEAHYPAEINFDNLDLYKTLEKETGIKLTGVAFSHFYDKMFEFGSLSNPYKEIREKAIEIAIGGLKVVKELGGRFAISWPGIDGYTYSLGTIFPWMWEWFESSMAEAMDEVPGVRVAIEPKPYEPAPNNIYRTTAEAILAAMRIESKLKNPENRRLLEEGYTLVGLNPEIGHVRMGYEDTASAYSLVAMEGRLAHVHMNSQPLGNYDQDLNVGVVEWQQAENLLFVLKMIGYREYMGIDINPERMLPEEAVKINIRALHIMKKRIDELPYEELIEAYLNPAENRGKIEMIYLDLMEKGLG